MKNNNFLGDMTVERLNAIDKRVNRNKKESRKYLRLKFSQRKFPVLGKYGEFKPKAGWKIITIPEEFRIGELEANKFIQNLHNIAFKARVKGDTDNIFLNMYNLKKISVPSAVMLAAEIMRCQKLLKYKLKGAFPNDIDVRLSLKHFGFFSLIETDNDPCPSMKAVTKKDFVLKPIQTMVSGQEGRESTSKALVALSELLYGGDQVVKNPLTQQLRVLLGEIILNVGYHAYINKEKGSFLPDTLWFTGMKNIKEGQLVFIIYDQGVSIPASLPQNEKWRPLWHKFVNRNDADLIEEATMLHKTSSPDQGRGNGLSRLKGITDKHDNSELTIYSGKGIYTYKSGEDTPSVKENVDVGIEGSMLIWRLEGVEEFKVKEEGELQNVA